MWSPPYIVAFIFGIFIILDSALVYLSKSRFLTLFLKLIFDLLSIAQLVVMYLGLGIEAVLPAIGINTIGATRDILFMFKEKYSKTLGYSILGVLLIITALSLIWTYRSPVSILPCVGTIINTTALYLTEQKWCKSLTICGQILFITYYAILIPESDLLTILNMIASIMTFVSAVVGLINLYINNKKSLENLK